MKVFDNAKWIQYTLKNFKYLQITRAVSDVYCRSISLATSLLKEIALGNKSGVQKLFFFFFFLQPISKCRWCERWGSRQKTAWVRLRAVLQSAWWERFRWLHILNVSCSPSQNYSTFSIMQNAGTLIVCINANVYKLEFFCVWGGTQIQNHFTAWCQRCAPHLYSNRRAAHYFARETLIRLPSPAG